MLFIKTVAVCVLLISGMRIQKINIKIRTALLVVCIAVYSLCCAEYVHQKSMQIDDSYLIIQLANKKLNENNTFVESLRDDLYSYGFTAVRCEQLSEGRYKLVYYSENEDIEKTVYIERFDEDFKRSE